MRDVRKLSIRSSRRLCCETPPVILCRTVDQEEQDTPERFRGILRDEEDHPQVLKRVTGRRIEVDPLSSFAGRAGAGASLAQSGPVLDLLPDGLTEGKELAIP